MSIADTSLQTGRDALTVYHVDLEHALEALEAEEFATPRLSSVEMARFQQKTNAIGADDARRWRSAHIALRIVLEQYLGVGLRGLAFEVEPGGRPRLPVRGSDALPLHFSLSHAGSDALFALSPGGAIGVDLEVTRQFSISDERRRRIEMAAEKISPNSPLPITDDARLLQAWVRLEAHAKATGIGIGRTLSQFQVFGAQDVAKTAGHVAVDVADLAIGSDRYAAIAAAGLPPSIVVRQFPATAGGVASLARDEPQ